MYMYITCIYTHIHIYVYIYIYIYIYKYIIYTCIYTNFEYLFYKCQVYINYSRRHFFLSTVIFRILRILNGLLQTKSVKKVYTN